MPSVVYRIQDTEGRGPWRPGFSHRWVEDRPIEEYSALLPTIVEFPNLPEKLRAGFHYGVGCTSVETLRRWIILPEWIKLKQLGFRCVKIDPDRIVEQSEIQCVFESSVPLRKHKRRLNLY